MRKLLVLCFLLPACAGAQTLTPQAQQEAQHNLACNIGNLVLSNSTTAAQLSAAQAKIAELEAKLKKGAK